MLVAFVHEMELAMNFELILGAVVSVGLFAYLGYALIRPERF